MAIATRNLYLVLKARDEASRVIRGFGRELSRTNALAQAEELRNAAAQEALRAAELRMSGATQEEIDKHVLLSRQLRSQAQDLERSHASTVRLANAMQSLSSTLVTVGSGLAIFGAAALVGFYKTIDVAREYARQVALTATQVTDFTVSLQQLGDIGLAVAKSIAVPFEDIQPALYDIFSSTNANLTQAQTLLTAFAKTAVAGQVSLQDASRGTIAIMNAYGIPLEHVNDILDIEFQLVRKGVGTYDDFAKVFGRVVPSATRANQSFQEVAAMLAYLTRNGLSAAMASTSAARALDALSNPKAVSNMESLGLKIRDVHGQLLPLQDVLLTLRKYLLSLPEPDRVKALVGIFQGAGGTIQARRFLDQILLRPGQLEQFDAFLKDMNNSTGAFSQAYGIMSDTVASKTQLLKNNFKVLEEFVGRTVMPVFTQIIGFFAGLLEKFNSLPDSTKTAIVNFALAASALTLFAGAVVVVIGLAAGLYAAILTAGTGFLALAGIVAGIVGAIIGLGLAFYNAWQKSEEFRKNVKQVGSNIMEVYTKFIKPVADGIRNDFGKYIAPAIHKVTEVVKNDLAPALKQFMETVWKKVEDGLDMMRKFVLPALKIAFQAIGWFITNIFLPAFKKLSDLYKEHKQTIDQIVKVIGFLVGALAAIAAVILVIVGGAVALALIAIFYILIKVFTEFFQVIILTVDRFKDLYHIVTDIPHYFGVIGAWFAGPFANFFKKGWDNVSGFFVTGYKAVIGFFAKLPDAILGALGKMGNVLFQAGKDLIMGFWNGISSMGSWLYDQVKSFIVNNVTGLVKNLLGSHSPSTVFRDIGSDTMLGFGQGVMSQARNIAAIMKNSIPVPNMVGAGVGAVSNLGLAQALSPLARAQANKPTQVTTNITVNTQEMNPARMAAELGWLLNNKGSM